MNSHLPASTSGLDSFHQQFCAIQGNPPFPWQERLFQCFRCSEIPSALDLPTGLGKTSVMAIWHLARRAGAPVPRRLVYVVDRRAVVDQATTVAETLKKKSEDATLRISTLRGRHVDNREWLADPAAPAIVVGTVDMIGSRLLFSGYGVSRGMRPYHAGLLGADTLVVLDEAHLVPPFEALLKTIARDPNDTLGPASPDDRERVPRLHLMSLSATGRTEKEADAGNVFRLTDADYGNETVKQRLHAEKRLALDEVKEAKALVGEIAKRAWKLATEFGPARVLVYCNSRNDAVDVQKEIEKLAKREKIEPPSELLVGERRVHEREKLFTRLNDYGFVDGEGMLPKRSTFLIATSAGEVGVDLDADHMVCDLVEWERMVQRLGRVNRRGGEGRTAVVEIVAAPSKKKDGENWPDRLERLRKPIDALNSDGSPATIVALKQDEALKAVLLAATTPPPLRPALTRALVDAWSMTSLEEHTGRPDIQPWLRGWVEDDEPQAMLAWRRWLPWREGAEKPIKKDVEDFFDAAPIHLDEMLEAPTWRILDWLIGCAKKTLDVAEKAEQAGEKPMLTENSPALIMLDRKGHFEKSDSWTVGELTDLDGKDRKRDKDALLQRLAGSTLVVSSVLGGLTENGMLDNEWPKPPSTLDDGWDEEVLRERIGYCVIGPADTEPDKKVWKLDAAIRLTRPEDAESEEVNALRVYLARGRNAARAGDQAIASKRQVLDAHQEMVAQAVHEIAEALDLPQPYRDMLDWVALHHDLGKDRDLWQNAMAPREPRQGRPWAKTTGGGDGRRLNGYRHEFGSLRDVAENGALKQIEHLGEDLRDLARHLIASHHGHARPVINAYEPLRPGAFESIEQTQARAQEAAQRFALLQRRWGPWGLAWWEAVFRAADQRASKRHDEGED